jgi:hypothetical protein
MGMHAILWAELRQAVSNKAVTVVMHSPFAAFPFVVAVRERGGSVKYLLLICGDESAAAHAEDGCGGWMDEMQERGQLQVTGGLRPPAEAKTVRVRRRQLLLSDGPFAETKEQIAGFCIIECADLTEAIEAAAKHPAAGYGTIEIRPLRP